MCQSLYQQVEHGAIITWHKPTALCLSSQLPWFVASSSAWHLQPWLNLKEDLIEWLIYSFYFLPTLTLFLVSPMSHGLPSTRTKYLTEEKCLPTAASVSLAGTADSWGQALELFLQEALWGWAIRGLSSAEVLFPTGSSQLERGTWIYLSFWESAIV